MEEDPELADGGATCGGGARGRTRGDNLLAEDPPLVHALSSGRTRGDNPASKAYNLWGWGKWGVRSRRRHRAPAEEALAGEAPAEAVGT